MRKIEIIIVGIALEFAFLTLIYWRCFIGKK